ARFVWGIFATKPGTAPCDVRTFSPGFQAAPVVLAVASVATGLTGAWLTPRLMSYAEELPAGSHEPVLTLWHGFTPALGLSVLCLAVGLALFWLRRPVAAAQHRVADRLWLPDAER